MDLDRAALRRLARLARLEYPRVRSPEGSWTEPEAHLIDDATLDALRGDITRILDHVAVLQEVDTTGVEPRTHGVPIESLSRADAAGETLDRERFLEGAPARSEAAVIVPKVVE